ncbi:hypothetical protein AB0M13_09270 [Nocardia fluminea]|uniref:hypothetical protein n=1 Tax=Nocardia fluminea TaxID=134984 RepID=UPI0034127178
MDTYVPVITAIVTILGALLVTSFTHRRERRDKRAMIRSDVETLKLLKEVYPGSDGVSKLESHIDSRIGSLTASESGKRDWWQIVGVLVFWTAAGALAYGGVVGGGAWVLLLLPAFMVFIFGLGGLPAFQKKPPTPPTPVPGDEPALESEPTGDPAAGR